MNSETINNISSIIKYDLNPYLVTYSSFVENFSQRLIDFYIGANTILIDRVFESLDDVTILTKEVESLISLHLNRLTPNLEYWDVLETLTDIRRSVDTYNNMQKWTRSNLSKARLSTGVVTETVLANRQTLEQLSTKIGATNKETYWLKIALDNNLREEDYTIEGGTKINVIGSNRAAISIQSVLDKDIVGEKIYGKDIYRKLSFNEEENDLETLSYRDTLQQNTLILATLLRGDTPEFENQGLQVDITGGGNRASIPFPILIRQYHDTFSRDDSYKSILLKSIEIEQDSLSLVIECTTKIGDTIEKQAVL